MVKGGNIKKSESSISKAASYKDIGEFWDNHDLAEYWDQTGPAKFDVDIQSEVTYYVIDRQLSEQIRSVARKRGVSANTLLNLLVQEKLLKGTNSVVE